MKRQEIPEWDGITDYRPPVFEEYEFKFFINDPEDKAVYDPRTKVGARVAANHYASEIVGDPSNSKWLERRKLTDAFEMGIEYARRYLDDAKPCYVP